MKIFKERTNKKINRLEMEVLCLKAELHDKDRKIENLKHQIEANEDLIKKIKRLPRITRRELGIYEY